MQRNVRRTAQLIDLCPDCRSVLKIDRIDAHPNHDKLRIYRFRCDDCGKPTSKTVVGRLNSSNYRRSRQSRSVTLVAVAGVMRLRPDKHIGQ